MNKGNFRNQNSFRNFRNGNWDYDWFSLGQWFSDGGLGVVGFEFTVRGVRIVIDSFIVIIVFKGQIEEQMLVEFKKVIINKSVNE